MFDVLYFSVIPLFASEERVQFSFVNVPQPWHAQSCYMHETALACRLIGGDPCFWKASAILFERQKELFDDHVLDRSRRQVYEELATWMQEAGLVPSTKHLMEYLVTGSGNSGNTVGQEIKYSCRYHRTRGVHVTPTVFINGIPETSLSSSTTDAEWKSLLDALLSPAKPTL